MDGLGALWLDDEEANSLNNVVFSKKLFRHHNRGGSQNTIFESNLESYISAKVCAVSSGTAALKAALVATGITRGDKVLVSALTFIASASAVASLGAIPIPLDIDEHGGIDLIFAEQIVLDAKALILVYLPGHSSNTDAVNAFCKRYNIYLIEDASQALGVSNIGGMAGTIGDIGVFSFQQGKQITSGEGGAVVATKEDLINKARIYSDHGCIRNAHQSPSWEHDLAMAAENYRMTELQAAVLIVQLRKLPLMLKAQHLTHRKVLNALKKLGLCFLESHYPEGNSGSSIIVKIKDIQSAKRILAISNQLYLPIRYVWRLSFSELKPFKYLQTIEGYKRPIKAEKYSKTMLLVQTPPLSEEVRNDYAIAIARCFFEGLEHDDKNS